MISAHLAVSLYSMWNGKTPYGTGIAVNGQTQVYGTVCTPSVCMGRCGVVYACSVLGGMCLEE